MRTNLNDIDGTSNGSSELNRRRALERLLNDVTMATKREKVAKNDCFCEGFLSQFDSPLKSIRPHLRSLGVGYLSKH